MTYLLIRVLDLFDLLALHDLHNHHGVRDLHDLHNHYGIADTTSSTTPPKVMWLSLIWMSHSWLLTSDLFVLFLA